MTRLSAIAVIYECANIPVEPGILARVMACLKHRGPHGNHHVELDNTALGHLHLRITPEEQQEIQPLKLKGLPFWIVLDGRLDNRDELLNRLSLIPDEGKSLTDAGLILLAYDHWGGKCFEYLIGEFAIVIYDERNRCLVCARDPLGDRTLFYSIHGSRVTIASEPRAVAEANGGIGPDSMNESAAVHFFARQAPPDGQTFYRDVMELPPAHAMEVGVSGSRSWRYWQADGITRVYGKSNDEYAARFLALLEESVRCRLRSYEPAAVLMSGGLDSTSVACLAARLTAPRPLTTISYVFDELHDCDERQYIESVSEKWCTHSIQIPCDDAWTFRSWDEWPHNPNYPQGNPYRLLRERALSRARQEDISVLLTGGFGDHLYGAGSEWLADLLAERRLREAGYELGLYLRYAGLKWLWRAGYIQNAIGRWRKKIPVVRSENAGHRDYPWLTDSSRQIVTQSRTVFNQSSNPFPGLIGLTPAMSSSGEVFHTNRHSLEFRHPYRDRRLVEYVLSLPADQLYFHNTNKLVLRNAMKGVMPEVVRTRLNPTYIQTLFFRGVSREKERISQILDRYGGLLHSFVRPDWMAKHFDLSQPESMDDTASSVLWLCISFLQWINRPYYAVAV
jgi:asparagine synthase (glutamine-hydrolysing)